MELCQRLRKMIRVNRTDTKTSIKSHRVILQHFAEILHTLISDLIIRKVELCECLYKILKFNLWSRLRYWLGLTVLSFNAWLRYSAPWNLIWLRHRWSRVSVYLKTHYEYNLDEETHSSLLYCFVILEREIGHHDFRSDFDRGRVLWASYRNANHTRSNLGTKRLLQSHCVAL